MPVLKLWDGARWHYGAAGDSDAEDEEGCKLLGWISPSANDQWHDVLALLCKAMHRKAPDIIFTFEDPSDFSDGALTRPPKADGVWPTDKLFHDVVNGEDWYELMLNCQRWMDAEQMDTVTLNGDSAPCLNVSVWRMQQYRGSHSLMYTPSSVRGDRGVTGVAVSAPASALPAPAPDFAWAWAENDPSAPNLVPAVHQKFSELFP